MEAVDLPVTLRQSLQDLGERASRRAASVLASAPRALRSGEELGKWAGARSVVAVRRASLERWGQAFWKWEPSAARALHRVALQFAAQLHDAEGNLCCDILEAHLAGVASAGATILPVVSRDQWTGRSGEE